MEQPQVTEDTVRFAKVPEWLLVAPVSAQAIRVFAFLACRYADGDGVAFPSQRALAKDLGLSVDTVSRAVKELESVGAVRIERRTTTAGDPDTNLYRLQFVPTGGGKNAGTRKNAGTCTDAGRGTRKFAAQTRPSRTQKNIYPPLHPPTDCGGDCDDGSIRHRPKDRFEYPEEFERFWSVYPRKVEKRRAFKCWQARLREGHTAEELIKAAEAYAEECLRKHRSQDYIKHASTFLGPNKPFEDYLARDSPGANGGGGLLDWIPEVPFEGEGIGA